jgi:hypothetical protein
MSFFNLSTLGYAFVPTTGRGGLFDIPSSRIPPRSLAMATQHDSISAKPNRSLASLNSKFSVSDSAFRQASICSTVVGFEIKSGTSPAVIVQHFGNVTV